MILLNVSNGLVKIVFIILMSELKSWYLLGISIGVFIRAIIVTRANGARTAESSLLITRYIAQSTRHHCDIFILIYKLIFACQMHSLFLYFVNKVICFLNLSIPIRCEIKKPVLSSVTASYSRISGKTFGFLDHLSLYKGFQYPP